MIRFITGVPGGGKTYYEVHRIYSIVTDSKQKDRYCVIYTNINQFDFSISPIVKPYDHDKIFERIKRLHKHYKRKASDATLIKMARRFGVYKALFVIDEAHNIFVVKNPVLVWWLSYHRHLYQDIDLITQNLSLIESKYKGFTEYFVKAMPQSLRLFQKTFVYRLFVDSRMTQKGRAGTEKLKFNPEVFKLYHSGDKPKSKNIIVRYLLLGLAFLIPASAIFYYIKHHWSSEDSAPTRHSSMSRSVHHPSRTQSHHSDSVIMDDVKLVRIVCIRLQCDYQGFRYPSSMSEKLIKETDSKLLHIEPDYRLQKYTLYVLATVRFQKLFQGVNHETNDNSVLADLLPDRQ